MWATIDTLKLRLRLDGVTRKRLQGGLQTVSVPQRERPGHEPRRHQAAPTDSTQCRERHSTDSKASPPQATGPQFLQRRNKDCSLWPTTVQGALMHKWPTWVWELNVTEHGLGFVYRIYYISGQGSESEAPTVSIRAFLCFYRRLCCYRRCSVRWSTRFPFHDYLTNLCLPVVTDPCATRCPPYIHFLSVSGRHTVCFCLLSRGWDKV